MFRHKSKDKSKKYIKLGEGNVFTLLNTNQKDSPKRDLTEQEQKVIKLLSAHKSYFNSNQAKAMLTDEDYLKYCKYNSFFEKCADFQREYYKLVECTILESKGQRAGLIDFELNLFRQLVDKKEHEFYIIDPQECVHMLSERIMDNLEAASFIIWMGFARQLYKEVTQQKAVEFDKESFVCPKEKRSGKPINFFYSSKVFKLMSIMSIVYMDYSLKKDFIEGLYFSRKIINEAMRETRFSDSSHKYLANDDVDLNKMYLYERGIKVSRGLEKMPAEIPSIIYSNNRSIRGESNKNAAKRYLEITLNSARYNKEGNLTGVGVFDQVDLKKLRNGELDKSIKFKLALNDSITALICNKENIKRNRNKNSMNWTVKPEWSLIALEIDCFIRIFEENADINSLFCNGQLLSKFKFIYKVLREFGFKDDNLKKITALI